MATDSITAEDSNRICAHMNLDHKKALLAYAKFYGGSKNPINVEMQNISSVEMKIKVDGKIIKIPFDHVLKDSRDAHKTLVSMIKELPKSIDS